MKFEYFFCIGNNLILKKIVESDCKNNGFVDENLFYIILSLITLINLLDIKYAQKCRIII